LYIATGWNLTDSFSPIRRSHELNNQIGIFFAGAFLGLFFAFGLAQTVHAEDVLPTPEVTPTVSVIPEPTEPAPTDTGTLLPSETPTPDPSLTPEPDGGGKSFYP